MPPVRTRKPAAPAPVRPRAQRACKNPLSPAWFHVTAYGNLPGILKHGLDPEYKAGVTWDVFASHVQGRTFLAQGHEAMSVWFDLVGDALADKASRKNPSGKWPPDPDPSTVPVTLRVDLPPEVTVHLDHHGQVDHPCSAYTTQIIPPSALSVWDAVTRKWVSIGTFLAAKRSVSLGWSSKAGRPYQTVEAGPGTGFVPLWGVDPNTGSVMEFFRDNNGKPAQPQDPLSWGKALTEWLHSSRGKSYLRASTRTRHLVENHEEPWTHGGCWILAEALAQVVPGATLAGLSARSGPVKGRVFHVLVCLESGGYLDALGYHAAPDALLPHYQNPSIPTPYLTEFDPEEAKDDGIPYSPGVVQSLAGALQRILPEFPMKAKKGSTVERMIASPTSPARARVEPMAAVARRPGQPARLGSKRHHQEMTTLQARKAVQAVYDGRGTPLGRGNFGVAFKVTVDGVPKVVKFGSRATVHTYEDRPGDLYRWIKTKWAQTGRGLVKAREEMKHEAGVANELRALGFTAAPETVYVEYKGRPCLVREWGELSWRGGLTWVGPDRKEAARRLDDLASELMGVLDAGWLVRDDLLIARRPDGSLFVADVGFWETYEAKPEQGIYDLHRMAETTLVDLLAQASMAVVPSGFLTAPGFRARQVRLAQDEAKLLGDKGRGKLREVLERSVAALRKDIEEAKETRVELGLPAVPAALVSPSPSGRTEAMSSQDVGYTATGRWGREGVGILFYFVSRGKTYYLLLKRSEEVLEPGAWGLPGGAVKRGAKLWPTAVEEGEEELGSLPPVVYSNESPWSDYADFEEPGFRYRTYLCRIPEEEVTEWVPELNWENDEYGWYAADALPEPLHPGVHWLFYTSPLRDQLGALAARPPVKGVLTWSGFPWPTDTPLYHATGAATAILRTGFLTRDRGAKAAAGGRHLYSVSFTLLQYRADAIAVGLDVLRQGATGEMSLHTLSRRLQTYLPGVYKEVLVGLDGLPTSGTVEDALDRYEAGERLVSWFDGNKRQERWFSPGEDLPPIKNPGIYTRRDLFFTLYARTLRTAHWRKEAFDPYFTGTDMGALATLDPAGVGVLTCRLPAGLGVCLSGEDAASLGYITEGESRAYSFTCENEVSDLVLMARACQGKEHYNPPDWACRELQEIGERDKERRAMASLWKPKLENWEVDYTVGTRTPDTTVAYAGSEQEVRVYNPALILLPRTFETVAQVRERHRLPPDFVALPWFEDTPPKLWPPRG